MTNTAGTSNASRAKTVGVFAFGALVFAAVIGIGVRTDGGGKGHCTLHVESVPSGASIFINGRLAGATPLAVEGLKSGPYTMRFEKEGWQPLTSKIDLDQSSFSVNERLETLPSGMLTVDVKPADAEVLLNGELVGYTGERPLKLSKVPAGSYELLIRKTNCDSYSARIEVAPDKPLSFSGFELKDKVYTMLDGLIKSEPQRLTHYIDLGHYLFVNGKLDEAVDIYTQGMEVMRTPLNFDGPGFPGEKNMPAEEVQLERRLRTEDEARYLKELEKHRAWQGKDTASFRSKLEEAQEQIARKNITSWEWAERAGQLSVQGRNYEKAAKIYRDHIAAVLPDGKDLDKAYVALMEVSLMQRDVASASDTFDEFYKKFENNGAVLRQCGQDIYVYNDRMRREKDRARVLELAEKALKRGLELPADPAPKSQAFFDLGTVLIFEGRPKDAVPAFEQSIAISTDKAVKEERSLRLGDALRKDGRLKESRDLYETLKKSTRTSIRESAETGLNFISIEENRRK